MSSAIDTKTKTQEDTSQVFDNRTEPEILLTYEQAATCLSITVELLKQWVKTKRVPFVKLSRAEIRFKKEQLKIWTDAQTVWPDEVQQCLYENAGQNASNAGGSRQSAGLKEGKKRKPSTRSQKRLAGSPST